MGVIQVSLAGKRVSVSIIVVEMTKKLYKKWQHEQEEVIVGEVLGKKGMSWANIFNIISYFIEF